MVGTVGDLVAEQLRVQAGWSVHLAQVAEPSGLDVGHGDPSWRVVSAREVRGDRRPRAARSQADHLASAGEPAGGQDLAQCEPGGERVLGAADSRPSRLLIQEISPHCSLNASSSSNRSHAAS